MIKKITLNALFALGMILSASLAMQVSAQTGVAPACVSLTAAAPTYTQNFDTLAATGTSSTVPAGFGFAETGTGANATYTAGTGSSTAGDTYSFGTAAAPTDRAFGSQQSGSVVPIIGACFVNDTGSALTSFGVSYDGEQYRLGATGRNDRLDFQYSTDATSLTTGTYIDVNALDFVAPVSTGTVGVLDGNAAANRVITANVPVTVAPGATFYIRYNSFDASGADDGLAIDNFNLAANINAPTAGTVDISGRVTNARGRGIANARVTMTDGEGNVRTALTDIRGFYMIEDVNAGQTVIFNARARGYNFTEPTQVVSLSEDTMTVNFSAYFGKGGGE